MILSYIQVFVLSVIIFITLNLLDTWASSNDFKNDIYNIIMNSVMSSLLAAILVKVLV